MSFTKITQSQLNSRGATTLPNQPTISAANLKKEFDAPAKEVVAPAVNNLITELENTTSAASLGAVAPTGRTGSTVQAVINSVSSDLATLESSVAGAIADAHTHSNKALLDTYTQTEADLAQAVADDHTHSNKALLDTYTQTESDLASAVADDHTHSNKSLLDSYSQSESDLADAVGKKHAHTNLALLETYSQTEANLSDAVTKKHAHSNKTVLDKFDESGGQPTYDGNPIGGGGASDTFKNIVSAGTTFTASGDNDTFKINAGSNVTITALSSPDKGIQISATGGGSSTGDMLMNDYDRSGDVKAASSSGNGIKDYVAGEIGKLDVSDSAVSGQYVSAVSEADGKISVTRTALPTIPTVVNTYSSTGTDAISGTGVNAALETLDVTDTAVSGQYVSAVSETDGKISVTRASLPTIPTVDQAYNASSTNAQSGTAVAGAISGKANTSQLDEWSSASQVQSDGTVTFTGLNDNYGYDLFAENVLASISEMTKTGSGTNVTLVYKTTAPVGTSCKLRIFK